LGGLALLALSGCYSYSPYGYGPYNSYPGGYGAPPPGGVIQQGPVLGPPATFTPQGSAAPTWQQSNGPIPAGSGGAGTVPEYNDPGTAADSPFGAASGSQASLQTAHAVASGPRVVEQDPHLMPIPVQTVSAAETEEGASVAGQPNKYDHDRESFAWLRGVVDFDEEDGTWNIIYDIKPEAEDRFGGSMTLITDDRFQSLQDQDVVLVEGFVDAKHRDRLGKPAYRVERLAKLVAKSS
jgi:hypothetical protein